MSRFVRLQLAPALLSFAVFAAGCVDDVGITCPPGQPSCDSDASAQMPDLAARSDSGGTTDGARDDAGPATVDAAKPPGPDLLGCSSTCDGCCDPQGNCHDGKSLDFCGAGSKSCMRCDPTASDDCKDGVCHCGDGAPCPDKSRCMDGKCVCDSLSCPNGCCNGSACTMPSLLACGAGGHACVPCSTFLADSCAGGDCHCGMGPACNPGQRCANGHCTCDAMSCPKGCCLQNQCIANPNPSACGTGGAACKSCEPGRANACVDGNCACGVNPQCVFGQACTQNGCACTPQSCTGCCAGQSCLMGNTTTACGVNGMQCMSCPQNVACTNGVCACPMGSFACAATMSCVSNCQQCPNAPAMCNGACVPNCANGCPNAVHACSPNGGGMTRCISDCLACAGIGMCV